MRLFHSKFFALAVAGIVSTAGLASSAKAEIIYHSANITISEGTYNLDLNGDGIVDFSITSALDLSFPCNGEAWVSEASASGNGTLFGPLAPGNLIGPGQIFGGDGTLESYLEKDLGGVCWKVDAFGPWVAAKSGYLGFSLQVQGETYYGWANLINKGVYTETVVLVGYAYENIPGRAIKAGQTSYAFDQNTGEMPAFLAIPWDEKHAQGVDCDRQADKRQH